jgi:hypothetical protein
MFEIMRFLSLPSVKKFTVDQLFDDVAPYFDLHAARFCSEADVLGASPSPA